MQKSSCSFGLAFAGSALDNHSARVEDLAPSLLALSTAINGLNSLVNKEEAKADLSINAFINGSFGIDLTLAQDFLSQVTGFFAGEGITSICNAKTLIDCIIEILLLKKWLQGRNDAEFKVEPDVKSVSVTVENKTIVINYFSYLGFRDPTCNEACSKVAQPLHQPGVDKLTVSTADKVFQLEASEVEAFETGECQVIFRRNGMRKVGGQPS